MKEKIKKIIFGYLPGFITGIIICGSISVIAATYFPSNDVTYDNSASGLKSTDVQGAIDELYGVCTVEPSAGETIIENAGLEKDPYECRYFFTGADTNNYINFNNEIAKWRIVSVECDGTIKIIRNNIGQIQWDSSNIANWLRPASLNTYLNGTYYNTLTNIAKSQIISHVWNIGGASRNQNDLTDTINSESSKNWNGKVGLITVSEFVRTCNNTELCGSLYSYYNYNMCNNYNWLADMVPSYTWTITPDYSESYNILQICTTSTCTPIYTNKASVTGRYSNVLPVLYLSSDIKITGGDGSVSNPYTIE